MQMVLIESSTISIKSLDEIEFELNGLYEYLLRLLKARIEKHELEWR